MTLLLTKESFLPTLESLIEQMLNTASTYFPTYDVSDTSQDYKCPPATTLMGFEILVQSFTSVLRSVHGTCKDSVSKMTLADMIKQESSSDELGTVSHATLFQKITRTLTEKTTGEQRSCPSAAMRIYTAIARLLSLVENDSRLGISAIYAINRLYPHHMRALLDNCCAVFGIDFASTEYAAAHDAESSLADDALLACIADEFTLDMRACSPQQLEEVINAVQNLVFTTFQVEMPMSAAA